MTILSWPPPGFLEAAAGFPPIRPLSPLLKRPDLAEDQPEDPAPCLPGYRLRQIPDRRTPRASFEVDFCSPCHHEARPAFRPTASRRSRDRLRAARLNHVTSEPQTECNSVLRPGLSQGASF